MSENPARVDRLSIRRRENGDNRVLLELFNEERFQHFGTEREKFETCEELQLWFDSLPNAGKFEIVGEANGEVVGFGGLYSMRDRLSHVGSITLGVREQFQRRGIGTQMLQTILATADVLAGLQRVQLTVFSDNEAAIKLYGAFGFEIEGRHRHYLRRGENFVDAFTMARISKGAMVAMSEADAAQRIREMRPFWSPIQSESFASTAAGPPQA